MIQDRHLVHGPLASPILRVTGSAHPGHQARDGARLRECIAAELERLESVERQISGQEIPDTYRDVSRFSQAALHYGLSSTRHTYDWLTAFEAEVMKHDETK